MLAASKTLPGNLHGLLLSCPLGERMRGAVLSALRLPDVPQTDLAGCREATVLLWFVPACGRCCLPSGCLFALPSTQLAPMIRMPQLW